jgi:hypothetical protein
VGHFSVLAVDSFASLKPFGSSLILTFHIFVIWFCARTQVRLVALVISANFVKIHYGSFHLVCMFTMYLVVAGSGFMYSGLCISSF